LKRIKELRDWSANQWYLLQVGLTIMTVINFVLLIMVNSKRLSGFLGLDEKIVIIISAPLSILIMWVTGKILVMFGWQKSLTTAQSRQSPVVMEILQKVRNIEEEIKREK